MWMTGLAMAILFAAVTGGRFVFAAPGAVYIAPRYDLFGRATRTGPHETSLIAAIGPIINIVIAAIAGALFFSGAFGGITATILFSLFNINAFLAFFNLLPFPPLDGSKVFAGNMPLWAALIVVAGVMSFVL